MKRIIATSCVRCWRAGRERASDSLYRVACVIAAIRAVKAALTITRLPIARSVGSYCRRIRKRAGTSACPGVGRPGRRVGPPPRPGTMVRRGVHRPFEPHLARVSAAHPRRNRGGETMARRWFQALSPRFRRLDSLEDERSSRAFRVKTTAAFVPSGKDPPGLLLSAFEELQAHRSTVSGTAAVSRSIASRSCRRSTRGSSTTYMRA